VGVGGCCGGVMVADQEALLGLWVH